MMTCIDLFSGCGGFSLGAEMAGARMLWAANHWLPAVTAYSQNHQRCETVLQDVQQADWTQVPAHDCLLASPACQGHADCRGKERPHHDALRSTAWAVVSAVECHRPPVFVVENVPQFLKWELFPAWRMALEAMGYTLAPHVLNSADFGVPQDRVRLFLIGTRSKAPFKLTTPKAARVSIRSVLNLDDGNWSLVNRAGRSAATLQRVARARSEFGKLFVMTYYGRGSGLTGRSLDRPIGTITTRARWAVVQGNRMRMLTVPEVTAAMSFPATYWLPENKALAVHLLGNAVCPQQAKGILQQIALAA